MQASTAAAASSLPGDDDQVNPLQRALVAAKSNPAAVPEMVRTLLHKLQHIIDRKDQPPKLIVDQVHVFATVSPELFLQEPACADYLKTILRTCVGAKKTGMPSAAADNSNPLAVMAARMLLYCHSAVMDWPVELLGLYLEDALGARKVRSGTG